MPDTYLPRIIDARIERSLESIGAIFIRGVRQCGKTRTAEEHSASAVYLQDLCEGPGNVRTAEQESSKLLQGDVPRLIDEWQTAPMIWNAVKTEVDRRSGERGQFILTGSTEIPTDRTMHSGAGRIARTQMRPMSLFESLDSEGSVSLKALFEGKSGLSGLSDKTLEDIAFLIFRGGWPELVGSDGKTAARKVKEYINTMVGIDVPSFGGARKDPAVALEVLRSLSRNASTQSSVNALRCGVVKNGQPLAENTMYSYLSVFRDLFVTEDVPPWNPIMRSKTPADKSWKRQPVDPSIAAVLLHPSPSDLAGDLNSMGPLFESLCIRDLRVYAQPLGGEVCCYRDRTGCEVDAVICLRDGRWAAIETRLRHAEVDDAADMLLRFRKKVDEERSGGPAFMMVLVSSGCAYRRKDGVFVAPIGCLRD
jgi:predicted AAA+ superfamily ATPase